MENLSIARTKESFERTSMFTQHIYKPVVRNLLCRLETRNSTEVFGINSLGWSLSIPVTMFHCSSFRRAISYLRRRTPTESQKSDGTGTTERLTSPQKEKTRPASTKRCPFQVAHIFPNFLLHPKSPTREKLPNSEILL